VALIELLGLPSLAANTGKRQQESYSEVRRNNSGQVLAGVASMIRCDKSMKAIVLRFLALIGMLSTTACVRASEPWDAPFAGDPRAILEAAKLIPVPDGQMVMVLLEQHRYVIDEN
jgi:neutral trehalase